MIGRILIIDNYDSFTYNLVQAFGALGGGRRIEVVRNDAVRVDELSALDIGQLVISPGPGGPDDAGVSTAAVRAFAGRVPVLGVCLGHQCIIRAFGGRVVQAGRIMHGKTSLIQHDGQGLFTGVPSPFTAARYHSLIAAEVALPDDLVVSARTPEDEIMAVHHCEFPLFGVQFHPESFLTRCGARLLANFLALTAC